MSVYDSLPSKVKHKVSLKKKEKYAFIKEYLQETLPNKRSAVADLEALNNKVQPLVKTKKAWTKLKSKRRRNVLTCREKKELKLFDIPKEGHKFDDFLPLHRMWQDYMRDIVDFQRLGQETTKNATENHMKLLKADYHGCMITVRKTKCPSLLGLSGIVLMETKNTFKIISKDNKVKCIPKENSIFAFELEGLVFTIHGNNFRVKASERVRKKFKCKDTIDF